MTNQRKRKKKEKKYGKIKKESRVSMKHKIFTILILILLFSTGCTYKEIKDPLEEKIQNTLKSMTLEEKIGQMLMISNRTPTYTDELNDQLKKIQPGGFILFSENFTNYEQTTQLIDKIRSTEKIPMFISVDQEGGKVQRLKNMPDIEITTIPDMQSLGQTKNPQLAYLLGKIMGLELNVFGINMDFAPVLDVRTNEQDTVIATRSFGSDAKLVSEMALSLADGLKENDIIPVVKHFPGHGSTQTDSHIDLPVIWKSKKQLEECDIIPFQKAIEKGIDTIMVGHIAVPNITGDDTPASLSSKLVTDYLKTELHFQGVVVSDALNMQALTKYYKEEDIYTMAVNAGIDILLMPENPTLAIETIKQGIENGNISQDRINDAVYKILKLKYTKISSTKKDKNLLNQSESQEIINQIKEG